MLSEDKKISQKSFVILLVLFSLFVLTVLVFQGGLSQRQIIQKKAQAPLGPEEIQGKKSVKILSDSGEEWVFEIKTPSYEMVEVNQEGEAYKMINLSGAVLDESSLGKPALPILSVTINTPAESSCTYEVIDPIFHDLENYDIYPAQVPDIETKLSKEEMEKMNLPGEKEYKKFKKDETLYKKDEFYPANNVIIEAEKILRGANLRTVFFYPFQYNPGRKTLRQYESFRVRLTCRQVAGVSRYLPRSTRDFLGPLKERLSGDQVKGVSSVLGTQSGADLLIITPPDFASVASTLALWRRQKGIYTVVKTTLETGTTAAAITSYIQNAYRNWTPAPSFVLLLGDAEFIPPHYKTTNPYDTTLIGTDLYYAAIDGTDYLPDLAVGRISADNLQQAMMIVNKIINYEKNPPTDVNFYRQGIVAAYFQDDNKDGYDDRPFLRTSEDIRNFLLSSGYTINRVYYTQSTVNPTNYNNGAYGNGEPLPTDLLRVSGFAWDGNNTQINNAVNNGTFWLNHRDHGNRFGWGYPAYSVNDVNGLSNGEKIPFVSSINCFSGWFDNETDGQSYTYDTDISFAEGWQRQSNGGSFGVVAMSRTSFSGHNDVLSKGLIDAIWPQFLSYSSSTTPIFFLGPALNYAKIYYSSLYADSLTRRVEMEELNLLGDPAGELWTGVPQSMTGSAPATMAVDATTINVAVNVAGALVTAVQNEQILGMAYSQSGSASISLNPKAAEGILTITATKHNYRPYEANVNVTSPTAVTFAGCWPYRYVDGKVIVYWETGSEIDNLGFNVFYNQTSNEGGSSQVNADLIPSASPGGMAGATYQFEDKRGLQAGFYWIEAFDYRGGREKFGPFELKIAPVAPTGINIVRARTDRLTITWAGQAGKTYEIEISKCNASWNIISSQKVETTASTYDKKPGLALGNYKVRVREKYGDWSLYKNFRVRR